MSCFVVNDYHVSALVAWGVRHGAIVGISPDALAHELASANRSAFSERYAGRYDSELVPFGGLDHSAGQDLPAVAIVKACDCLAYQASDWSAWDGSEPSAHLAAIRARALGLARLGAVAWGGTGGRADQDGRDLPGYDAAAWELSGPDLADQDTEAHQARACDRVARIEPAYTDHHDAHGRIGHDSRAYFLADVLADLRHYCDAHGLDFAECDARGRGHYLAERADLVDGVAA